MLLGNGYSQMTFSSGYSTVTYIVIGFLSNLLKYLYAKHTNGKL